MNGDACDFLKNLTVSEYPGRKSPYPELRRCNIDTHYSFKHVYLYLSISSIVQCTFTYYKLFSEVRSHFLCLYYRHHMLCGIGGPRTCFDFDDFKFTRFKRDSKLDFFTLHVPSGLVIKKR